MTIEEVMRLAREAAHKRATPANWHGLEAALQALVAQARDEEAEACEAECGKCFTAETAGERLRARIAARKGGA